mmetsp:Transcript_5580/g.11453  ORF Transcript_5580/g.11453 Transcript_5580/m.11453 type:complete len:96 (-) Transcript_5580:313-600(-)
MQKYRIFDTPSKLSRIDAHRETGGSGGSSSSSGSSRALVHSSSASSKSHVIKTLKVENDALKFRIQELEGQLSSLEEKTNSGDGDGITSSSSWFY